MNAKFTPLPAIEKADEQQFVDTANNRTLLRYFQNIERQYKFANNIGVAIDDNDQAENGTKAVYLRDLFVRPNLSQYHISPEHQLGNDHDKALNITDLLAQHQRLFMLGDPGMGKSTLISSLMLAFSYYTDNLTKIALGKRVPFALILRDLDLQQVSDWHSLWQTFLAHNKKFTEPLHDNETLEQVFNSGQALIMLDGLDEITHSGQRKKLGQAVLEAMRLYPRCLFLISSRIIGFNQAEWFDLPIETENSEITGSGSLLLNTMKAMNNNASTNEDIKTLKHPLRPSDMVKLLGSSIKTENSLLASFYLCPFDYSQVQQFISNWYRLYVPKQVNHQQRIQDLSQTLKSHDGLAVLGRIPVMLNMICFIHARRARLPNGRAELYQRIAETYLISLDKARGLYLKDNELSFDYHDFSAWLAEIAYKLQEKRTEQDSHLLMSESEVLELLRNALLDYGCTDEQTQQQGKFVIEYFGKRTGIFIPRGQNAQGEELYGFAHLSFLEFFAAHWLKLQAPIFTKPEWNTLRAKIEQQWWHETFALFFESLDNAKLAEQCLKQLFPLQFKKYLQLDTQQNLLSDIVMDSSVRLPMTTRKDYIKRLADIYLHKTKEKCWEDNKPYLAARLCSDYCDAIEYLTELWAISFAETTFNNFALLARLTKLHLLELSATRIHDLSLLIQLQTVHALYLGNTAISDLSPLAKLQNLQTLWLSNTVISDLSPLTQLHQLQTLGLSNTKITDLSPLAQLHELQWLMLNDTAITDLNPLAQLQSLRRLWLDNTTITDLSPLANLTNLQELHITGVKANADVLKKHLPNLKIIQ